MKVLMFSSDPENPRLKRYAEVLDKLEIIDLSRKRGRILRFWKGYFEAKNLLTQEKFDLITAQEVEHSFLAWRLSKKFGTPWQMQIHTDIFSPYFARELFLNKMRVLLAKFLIPRAGCVRVVSERIKRSIGRDAVVLPIFSETKDGGGENMKQKYPGYDFYILMVGRLAREKNIGLALAAMREVIKEFNGLLVIIGDGPERQNLEKEVLDGLEANVRFEGAGWGKDLTGYYQSADCLLLSSNYEGYGLVTIEAIQNGLPVIMSDVGVAGEIIKNDENGIIVPVGDAVKFTEAILRLQNDKELRSRLIEGTRKTKLPYASFEEYRDKLVNSWKTCRR